MGCNCKKVDKIDRFIRETNGIKKIEKKGFQYWKEVIGESIENMINGFLVILLLIIICPLICFILILSYILKGRFIVPLPKFMFKILKKAEQKIKEEQVKNANG